MDDTSNPGSIELSHPIFATMRELHDAHAALLSRYRADEKVDTLVPAVHEFMRGLQESGVLLESEDERYDAQNVMTYWSNVLYRLEGNPTEFELAEFAQERAPNLPEEAYPYDATAAFMIAESGETGAPHRLLRECLMQLCERGLVAVVGAIGSGRSAFVNNVLLATLRAGKAIPGSETWTYCDVITPGTDPLDRLVKTVFPKLAADPQAVGQRVEQLLARDDALATLVAAEGGSKTRVVCIDNLDELFSECTNEQQRKAFADNLYGFVRESSKDDVVILIMRRDCLGRLSNIGALGEEAREAQVPMALTPGELKRAILVPAEIVGLKFDDGLVDRLVLDIHGDPAALALMQFTMRRLWAKKRLNRITKEAYDEVGAGSVALERAADTFYDGLEDNKQDIETARQIMMTLVRPSGSRDFVAPRVTRDNLSQACSDPEGMDRILSSLLGEQLVHEFAATSGEPETFVLAHLALVDHWPRLIDWLEEERFKKTQRLRLTTAADQWDDCRNDSERAAGVLWRGGRLEEAREEYSDLSPVERAFLDASQAAVDRAREAKEAARRREIRYWRTVASFMIGATIVTVILAAIALDRAIEARRQRGAAEQEANLARAAEGVALAAEAEARVAEGQSREAERKANSEKSWAEQSKFATASQSDLREGLDMIAARDLPSSLPWLREALYWDQIAFGRSFAALHPESDLDPMSLEITDSRRDRVHQKRIGCVLEQIPRLGLNLFQQDDMQMTHVDVSPDGRRLVTASGFSKPATDLIEGDIPPGNGAAAIWDATNGDLLVPLPHNNRVTFAAFNNNGSQVLTACQDGTARLWDAGSGDVLQTFEHPGPVSWAAINHDGTRVLTVSSQPMPPVNTEGDAGAPTTPKAGLANAGFSVSVWDSNTGRNVFVETHNAAITHAEFNPKGTQIVTSSQDMTACVWNAAENVDGDRLVRRIVHDAPVSWATFSPDGSLVATACQDGEVSIVTLADDNATDGVILSGRHDEGEAVESIVFSPDGNYVVTASADATAFVWQVDADSGITRVPMHRLRHGSGVHFATFSPDSGMVVTASRDRTARVWDVRSGQPVTPPLRHRGGVNYATFGPDGARVLTCSGRVDIDVETEERISDGGEVRVWLLNSRRRTYPTITYTGSVVCASFSPDRKRLAVGGIGSSPRSPSFAQVWDLETGRPLTDVLTHDLPIRSVSFDNSGKWLVTASSDGVARIWNSSTGEQRKLKPTIRHAQPLTWAGFSPDGRWVLTASEDRTARLWNIEQPLEVTTLPPLNHGETVLDGAFSPNGKLVATASADDVARIWELGGEEGTRLRTTIPLHTADVTHVCFSHSNRYLVTASVDQTARVWGLDGTPITPSINHDRALSSATFSPDDLVLATVSEDRTVRLWDLSGYLASSSGSEPVIVDATESWTRPVEPIAPTLRHAGRVRTAVFAGTGEQLLTVNDDKMLQVSSWQLPELGLTDQQLGLYAAVLTGQDVGQTGAFKPLDRDIQENYWDFVSKNPTYGSPFGLNEDILTESVDAWHQQQAQRSEVLGLSATAIHHLNRLLREDPNNASLLARRANAYFVLGQRNRDAGNFQHALEGYLAASRVDQNNPSNYLFFERRGGIHRNYAGAVLAQESESAASQIDADWQSLVKQLRRAAVEDFGHAIELHPGSWQPIYTRGRTSAELSNWEDARADLAQAASLKARLGYVWYFLALVQLLQEDEEAYRETCAEMADLFAKTESPQIANIVVWTNTLRAGAYEASSMTEQLATAAHKLNTEDRSFYLHTLAAATFREAEKWQLNKGDTEWTSAQFQKALDLLTEAGKVRGGPTAEATRDNDQPVDNLYRALIHHAMRDEANAKSNLQKAADWLARQESGEASAASWTELAQAKILHREADNKINGKP